VKFSRELSAGNVIRRVTETGFVIGDNTFPGPLFLTADEIFEGWAGAPVAELKESHFDPVLQTSPELILLGTGATNIFPPRELVFAMARRGVGFEVMNSKAAARTFNVLVGEERRVAAVLYL
jgi:uncharacterized protein